MSTNRRRSFRTPVAQAYVRPDIRLRITVMSDLVGMVFLHAVLAYEYGRVEISINLSSAAVWSTV